VDSKYCSYANNGLFISTTGKVSNCCIQNQRDDVNWDTVDDLQQLYYNVRLLKSVKESLDNNQEHPACDRCWKREKLGLDSKRIRDGQHQYSKNIEYIDLRLTNKCNLQCRMCNPSLSSQLNNISINLLDKNIKHNLFPPVDNNQYALEKVLDLILELPSVKTISLAGGEPFLMPEVEEFLCRLVEKKKFNINLKFFTNCTIVKPKILNVIKKFKSVELNCSIDGVDKELEYQRYPAKWKSIEKNFNTLYNESSDSFKVNITPTLTLLNLVTVDKFLHWANNYNKSSIGYSEVTDLTFLNFRYVPLEVRDSAISNLKNIKLHSRFDNAWQHFIQTEIHQHNVPSSRERLNLKFYANNIWNYNNNTDFLKQYPWMQNFIDV
jgi:organic radical activating enzyme